MRDKTENKMLLAVLGIAGLVMARPGSKPQVAKAATTPHAPQPAPVSATGWWTVIKRVGAEISENQLMTQAAAVTFYALLSIFPALAALVSIYGLVADPKTILDQVNALSAVLPGGGQEILRGELQTLTAAKDGGLGWGVVLGIATSLWTSNQAMKALFNALNAVHDTKETRSFIKLTAMTLLCTVGVILFMVIAMAAVVVVPAVLGFLGLGSVLDWAIRLARWPILLVAVAALLAVLYRFGPCRSKVVWRWVTSGSAFAAISWVLVSILFSWYVANFGSYNKTYGSLGAVIGFMTWIWISSTVVLIGAQLDAELEKATVGRQRTRKPGADPLVRDVPAAA